MIRILTIVLKEKAIIAPLLVINNSYIYVGVGNFATKHHYEIKIQVNSPLPC
jgi:hypothetical protein